MRLQPIENINFIYVFRIVEMNLKSGESRSVSSWSLILQYLVDVLDDEQYKTVEEIRRVFAFQYFL